MRSLFSALAPSYRRLTFVIAKCAFPTARLGAKKVTNFITKGFRFLLLLLRRLSLKSHKFKLLILVVLISLINFRMLAFSVQYLYAEYKDHNAGIESFYCYDRQMHRIESGPEKGLLIKCEDYDKYYAESKGVKFYKLKEITNETNK